jgi:prophage antirepressor-like protein
MRELLVLQYNDEPVRLIKDDQGNPWWVAKDVCSALGIKDHIVAVRNLESDEVGVFDTPHPQSPLKTLAVNCINEPGLYTLILRSNKPEAKAFKRWITHEVLPALRKTGSYSTRPTDAPKSIAPVQKEFDAALKMAKAIDLKGGEKILAANMLTKDVTGYSPLALLGIDESRYVAPPPDPTPAGVFFEGLCSLTGKQKVQVMEMKGNTMRVRVSLALDAINEKRRERLDKWEVMKALRAHPSFLCSNRMVRANFGSEEAIPCKVWEFNPDLMYQPREDAEEEE